MTAFITKSVTVKTLGEHLRLCREDLGLSIIEVSQIAKVQPRYIKALEESDFNSLPATVYVKGFLKTLVKVYKIDERELIAEFNNERGIAENLQILKPIVPKTLPGFYFIWNAKMATIATLVILGFGMGLYLYSQVNSLQNPPALKLLSPVADGIVNTSLLTVRGETDSSATVYLNNEPIALDAMGNFQETISLGPGTNQLTIKSVNKFGKESILNRSINLVEKEIAGLFTTGTSSERFIYPLDMEIRLGKSASWVSIFADGVEIYSGTMLPGSKQRISAKNQIILSTANAGVTQVILNNKDLGVLGKDGESIQDIEFTK